LFAVSANGGPPRLLLDDAGEVEWAPDSRHVVTTRRRDLVVVDVQTRRVRTVARGAFRGWSFSPSGDDLVYARAAHPRASSLDGWNVYRVHVRGGAPRALTQDGHSTFPTWGRRGIAFSRFVPKAWPLHRIWTMRGDGSGARVLTRQLPRGTVGQGLMGLIPIAWSARGDVLLGANLNEWGTIPYRVSPQSGAARALGSGSHTVGLSGDGRWALVQTGSNEGPQRVEAVPVDGGRPRVLARDSSSPSWNR
jgi:Tol biopolymer transport system component